MQRPRFGSDDLAAIATTLLLAAACLFFTAVFFTAAAGAEPLSLLDELERRWQQVDKDEASTAELRALFTELRFLERRLHEGEATRQQTQRLGDLKLAVWRALSGSQTAPPTVRPYQEPPLRVEKADPVPLQGADNCHDAPVIDFGGAPAAFSGTTAGATVDGESFCDALGIAPDVWYRVSLPEPAVLFANTLGSSFDTVLSVYDACPGSAGFEIQCNDNSGAGEDTSAVVANLFGDTVWIRVSGAQDEAGDYVLNVSSGGRIAGRAVSPSGAPIAGLEVLATGGVGGSFATTGADGRFLLEDMAAGFYRVVVREGEGFLGEAYPDIVCLPEIDCLSSGQLVEVALGETTELGDFELTQGAAVEGRVVEKITGLPLENASVQLVRQDDLVLLSTFTDADGRFRFDSLPGGTYFADAFTFQTHQHQAFDGIECPAGFCPSQVGTPIPVALGSVVTGIDFHLERLGVVTGHIRDASGAPLDFQRFTLHDLDGQALVTTLSDPDGSFELGGLRAGSYLASAGFPFFGPFVRELFEEQPCVASPQGDCDFTAATVVEVETDAVAHGLDFTLSRGGSLSGRVVDERLSVPLGGIRMNAYVPGWGVVAEAHTDEDGRYRLEGLAGGGYKILAYSDTFFPVTHLDVIYPDVICGPLTCPIEQGETVTVAFEQAVTGLDFALPRTARVSGRVTRTGTGEPLAGAEVSSFTPSGNFLFDVTDFDGFYDLPGFDPGTYQLEVAKSDFLPASRTLEIEVGVDLEGVDFELSTGGRITGRVVDRSGQGLEAVEVVARDEDGTYVKGDFPIGGSYEITALPPGSYHVQVLSFGNHVDQAWPGVNCPERCFGTEGQLLTLAGDETVDDIDFELDRFATLSGRSFASADGSPVGGVVELRDAAGQGVSFLLTDGLSPYVFSRVPAGDFTLVMFPEGDYAGEVLGGGPCFGANCYPDPGAAFSVDYNQELENLDFTLEPGGTLSGEVRSGGATPIDDVFQVSLYTADGRFAALTEVSSGSWFFTALPAGDYRLLARDLRVFAPLFFSRVWPDVDCLETSCDVLSGETIAVNEGGNTTGVDFTMTPIDDQQLCPADELCLLEDRFRVTARWDTGSAQGTASAEGLTDESGYFWFFDQDNVEVVVKMLDACVDFDRFWVFAAGLTNVEVELTVLDTQTGSTQTYVHGGGDLFKPIFDTQAFDTCPGGAQQPGATAPAIPAAAVGIPGQEIAGQATPGQKSADEKMGCQPSAQAGCLNEDRFRVEATWSTGGAPQPANVVPLTSDTAYFWFFGPDNLEVVLKVLDACDAFGRYWVFAAGLTNVEVELKVTDTENGLVWTYRNENGTDFLPVADTGFLVCP